MKTLYLIGNGFDIHHSIPSRYSNYQNWLEENDMLNWLKANRKKMVERSLREYYQ